MNIKYLYLWVFLILAGKASFSQQQDAVLWAGLNLEKKITRQLEVSATMQSGFNQNWQELRFAYAGAGISWRWSPNWTTTLRYRFSQVRNLENFYDDRQVVMADLSYAKSWNAWTASFRTRYQQQFYGLHLDQDENYKNNKHIIRNRVSLRYRINTANSLLLAQEQYYRMDLVDATIAWRTGLGFTHKFDLHHKLDAGFNFIREVNSQSPDIQYVTSFTYTYLF